MERAEKRVQARISVAIFITDDKNRLLLVEQNREGRFLWNPVAGGLKLHEGPREAALREAREEIGVGIDLKDVIGIYPIDREETLGIGFVFRAEIIGGEISPEPEKISNVKYFTLKEIKELFEKELIYRPNEYNLRAINDWQRGRSFPLEVVGAIK